MARFLIEELSADPSPIDQWKTTPLDAAWDEGHEDMRTYLESKGAKRCKGMLLTGADKESDLCVHISPISPYISPVSPPDKESDLCDAAALTQPQPQP